MATRLLGRSGLGSAPLSLGGKGFGWTAGKPTSFALLARFVERFRVIDTADAYASAPPICSRRSRPCKDVPGLELKSRPVAGRSSV